MLATLFLGISVLFIGYLLFTRKTKFTSKYTYTKEDASNFVDTNCNRKHFTTKPSESVDIKFTKKGVGSIAESPPITVFELFNRAMKNNGDSAMLAKEYVLNSKYKWKYLSRSEVKSQVLSAARAFISLGLKPWESVCIMGFNAPEWYISDIAAIFAGGLAVGLYPTNSINQCKFIINDCNARILVLENKRLLQKFIEIDDDDNNIFSHVSAIIIYDDNDIDIANYNDVRILSWNDLLCIGNNKSNVLKYNEIMYKRQQNIVASNCCTLIYTSGTTGQPKGVMLSHDNVIWSIKSILSSQRHLTFWGKNAQRQRLISYLPLSHIAAQSLDIYAALMIAYHGGDGTIYFARNDALKGSLIKTLRFVKPTVFLGVPRVWEKIEEKMRLIGRNAPRIAQFISTNAKAIGLRAAHNKELEGNRDIPLLYPCAKGIFSMIKSQLGFSDLQLAITGAAPIKMSTLQYFHSIGIDLIEAYGLSESNALITMGLHYHHKIGSVGVPLLGVNVRIDKDNRNEICAKGRNIMMGYIHDLAKTKETFTDDGYLRTGDNGRIDGNNLLYITGRIKEIIITSGGENIAPVPIEQYLKTVLSAIRDCCLIGNERKYLTLLVTLKTEPEDSVYLDVNALNVDGKCKTIADAKQSQRWLQYIKNGIDKYNGDTQHCVSRAQRVQYFRILDAAFSENTGEITSTLKLKRSVIVHKFKHIIDTMY